jgi:hypothetical protein
MRLASTISEIEASSGNVLSIAATLPVLDPRVLADLVRRRTHTNAPVRTARSGRGPKPRAGPAMAGGASVRQSVVQPDIPRCDADLAGPYSGREKEMP